MRFFIGLHVRLGGCIVFLAALLVTIALLFIIYGLVTGSFDGSTPSIQQLLNQHTPVPTPLPVK